MWPEMTRWRRASLLAALSTVAFALGAPTARAQLELGAIPVSASRPGGLADASEPSGLADASETSSISRVLDTPAWSGLKLSLQAELTGIHSDSVELLRVQFTNPRFACTKWTLDVELFRNDRYARNSRGASMVWSHPIRSAISASLGYELEQFPFHRRWSGYTTVGAVRQPIEYYWAAGLDRGHLSSSVRGSIQYDTRDRKLSATSGAYHAVFAEIADELTASENEFVRYGGFTSYYRPLWGPLLLRASAQVGVITSRDPLGVPMTERYLLGGPRDLRGFHDQSLGPIVQVVRSFEPDQPLGRVPLGGNLQLVFMSELERPLYERFGISGVAFFDAGNAYNLEDRYCGGESSGDISANFDPCFRLSESLVTGLRFSTGFGVRWASRFGLLRLEWGIPLDRMSYEDKLRFILFFSTGRLQLLPF